jgi:hypothetical protein
MPVLIILLAAIAFAAAILGFVYTAPTGPSFWYGHPGWELMSAWVMLLTFAALFIGLAIFAVRRASPKVWFFALAASCLPVLAALLPVADYLHVITHSEQYLDAGGDVPFQIACLERVYILSLVLCVILAGMATFGFSTRRRT